MTGRKMLVDCKECPFRKKADPEGEKKPAEIVRQHGKQTGHKLKITAIEE